MDDTSELKNALWRRENQLRVWDTSETNSASATPRDRQSSAVKFNDGCVFLAACSSGDTKEVIWLLGRGADINTANVDGLTALHQACIDDNLTMVKFLVEQGADIDACDNEGWTALHATASCGFVDIARYLIEKGARLDAVNNDGELSIDLAEGKEMSVLLSDAMQKQGIDAECARKEEEEMMLRDANQWLNGQSYNEQPHSKTGAMALHVAAAKGYIKVIKILLEAGADVNARDFDGWTPLHAAAHWGQDEACKILAEHFGNMAATDNAGRTPIDVADPDVERLLEELKKQQDMMRKDLEDKNRSTELIREISPGKLGPRRSSVTRLSVDQKQILAQKNAEDERHQLQSVLPSVDEVPGAETSPPDSSPGDAKSAPVVLTSILSPYKQPSAGTKTAEETTTKPATDKSNTTTATDQSGSSQPPMVNGLGTTKLSEKSVSVDSNVSKPTRTDTSEKSVSDDEIARLKGGSYSSAEKSPPSSANPTKLAVIGRQPATTISSEPVPSAASVAVQPASSRVDDAPALWRASLRKTGSADIVCPVSDREPVATTDKQLPRSSSVSLAPTTTAKSDAPSTATETVATVSPRRMGSAQESDAKSRTELIATGAAATTQPSDPYARYKAQLLSYGRTTTTTTTPNGVGRTTATVPPTVMSATSRPAWTTPAPTTITTRQLPSLQYIRRQKTESDVDTVTRPPGTTIPVVVTTTTGTVSGMLRRSSEIPKRDDEKEIERKARARRARESRRSTQGVSKEDIEKAGASLQAAASSGSSSSGSLDEQVSSPSPVNSPTAVPTDRLTATNTKSSSATDTTDDPLTSYRKSRDSSSFSDSSFSTGFMRSLRNAGLAAALSSSTTSATKPGSVATTTTSTSAAPSAVTTTTQSITSPKSTSEHTLPGNSSEDGEDSVLLTAAARARRRRETRRPLGIIQSMSVDNKSDDNRTADSETQGKPTTTAGVVVRTDRVLPATCLAVTGCSYSLVPSSASTTQTQSTNISDSQKDFKMLYEQERRAGEKLQTELDDVKRQLVESRAELDRLRNSGSSIVNTPLVDITSERRERRALERKISELEEELKAAEALRADNQRLREENGALIRVISKLSK